MTRSAKLEQLWAAPKWWRIVLSCQCLRFIPNTEALVLHYPAVFAIYSKYWALVLHYSEEGAGCGCGMRVRFCARVKARFSSFLRLFTAVKNVFASLHPRFFQTFLKNFSKTLFAPFHRGPEFVCAFFPRNKDHQLKKNWQPSEIYRIIRSAPYCWYCLKYKKIQMSNSLTDGPTFKFIQTDLLHVI